MNVFFYTGFAGTLCLLITLACAAILVRSATHRARSVRVFRTLLAALFAIHLSNVTWRSVSEDIVIDRSEQEQTGKKLQEKMRKLQEVRTIRERISAARFAEESPEDIAKLEEAGKKALSQLDIYERAMLEAEQEDNASADGQSEPTNQPSATDQPANTDSEPNNSAETSTNAPQLADQPTEFEYRKQGKQQRTAGKKKQTDAGIKIIQQDIKQQVNPWRLMVEKDKDHAIFLGRLFSFLSRVIALIALLAFLADYFFRFNSSWNYYLPIPLALIFLDRILPKKMSTLVSKLHSDQLHKHIADLIRKGDFFILFTDKDPFANTQSLPRLSFGHFTLLPVIKYSGEHGEPMQDADFILESAWHGRACFVVQGAAAIQQLTPKIIEFLEYRFRTRASTSRTLHVLWDLPQLPSPRLLDSFLFATRRTNIRFLLAANPATLGSDANAFQESFDQLPQALPYPRELERLFHGPEAHRLSNWLELSFRKVMAAALSLAHKVIAAWQRRLHDFKIARAAATSSRAKISVILSAPLRLSKFLATGVRTSAISAARFIARMARATPAFTQQLIRFLIAASRFTISLIIRIVRYLAPILQQYALELIATARQIASRIMTIIRLRLLDPMMASRRAAQKTREAQNASAAAAAAKAAAYRKTPQKPLSAPDSHAPTQPPPPHTPAANPAHSDEMSGQSKKKVSNLPAFAPLDEPVPSTRQAPGPSQEIQAVQQPDSNHTEELIQNMESLKTTEARQDSPSSQEPASSPESRQDQPTRQTAPLPGTNPASAPSITPDVSTTPTTGQSPSVTQAPESIVPNTTPTPPAAAPTILPDDPAKQPIGQSAPSSSPANIPTPISSTATTQPVDTKVDPTPDNQNAPTPTIAPTEPAKQPTGEAAPGTTPAGVPTTASKTETPQSTEPKAESSPANKAAPAKPRPAVPQRTPPPPAKEQMPTGMAARILAKRAEKERKEAEKRLRNQGQPRLGFFQRLFGKRPKTPEAQINPTPAPATPTNPPPEKSNIPSSQSDSMPGKQLTDQQPAQTAPNLSQPAPDARETTESTSTTPQTPANKAAMLARIKAREAQRAKERAEKKGKSIDARARLEQLKTKREATPEPTTAATPDTTTTSPQPPAPTEPATEPVPLSPPPPPTEQQPAAASTSEQPATHTPEPAQDSATELAPQDKPVTTDAKSGPLPEPPPIIHVETIPATEPPAIADTDSHPAAAEPTPPPTPEPAAASADTQTPSIPEPSPAPVPAPERKPAPPVGSRVALRRIPKPGTTVRISISPSRHQPISETDNNDLLNDLEQIEEPSNEPPTPAQPQSQETSPAADLIPAPIQESAEPQPSEPAPQITDFEPNPQPVEQPAEDEAPDQQPVLQSQPPAPQPGPKPPEHRATPTVPASTATPLRTEPGRKIILKRPISQGPTLQKKQAEQPQSQKPHLKPAAAPQQAPAPEQEPEPQQPAPQPEPSNLQHAPPARPEPADAQSVLDPPQAPRPSQRLLIRNRQPAPPKSTQRRIAPPPPGAANTQQGANLRAVLFPCPSCGGTLTGAPELRGTVMNCPLCNNSITMPGQPPPPAQPPAPTPQANAPIEFSCTACSKRISAPATMAGHNLRCPYCQAVVLMPLNTLETPAQPQKFKFFCAACGQKLSAEHRYIGMPIGCPRCKASITIPQPT